MSQTLSLITPPAIDAGAVALPLLKGILRMPSTDYSWDPTLTFYLQVARERVEQLCRIKLITQTWLLREDVFPMVSLRYDRNGYAELALPYPPFQSVASFQYVDTAGIVQTLIRNTDYNNNVSDPFYSYQMKPGSGTSGIQPAKLYPAWARPWPPQRLVPANTLVQFRCGYGGPLTVSMTGGSAVLASPGFTFNADDAPQMAGDIGAAISIPGAGPLVNDAASTLNTTVASVANGVATLATAAAGNVANVTAWLGAQIPYSLQLNICFQAQFYFEQGAVVDQLEPRVIAALKNGGYRNLVS